MSQRRIVSLAALSVLELSPPEMVRIAARCGYTHVGLRPIAATDSERHFPLLADAGLRRETLAALADEGVGVLDIEILRLRPDTDVRAYEAALEFGAEAGARFALVAGNDPDRARIAGNLGALADLAATYGIRPHLEFMPWTDVPDLAVALDVIAAAGRGNTGLLVDAYHLVRSESSVADIPERSELTGYVQLCDIAGPVPADVADLIAEARSARLPPGAGECPLQALMARLPPGIPVSLEVPMDAARDAGMDPAARAALVIEAARPLLAA